MPMYVYRRDDGSTFELVERMSADALLTCPTTGLKVERVLQPFSPRYTGTGFYATDHRKEQNGECVPKPSPSEGASTAAPSTASRPDIRSSSSRTPR